MHCSTLKIKPEIVFYKDIRPTVSIGHHPHKLRLYSRSEEMIENDRFNNLSQITSNNNNNGIIIKTW